MTPEEEGLFRQAAREALATGRDVLMVAADDPEQVAGYFQVFSVVHFGGQQPVAIVIPAAWQGVDGMEDRCQCILRQESKAMVGQGLD